MNVFGRSTVSEFLGDSVVYRNLEAQDTRLPQLNVLRREAGIPPGGIPRKHEAAYAKVITRLLERARELDGGKARIQRLAFIGDTRMADGNAFDNICNTAGWQGVIFIGAETKDPPIFESVTTPGGQKMILSNRWSALTEGQAYNFRQFCSVQHFPIDEHTAVIVDLDKTAIAARGRNALVIDQARIQAVSQTVENFLGEGFNNELFLAAYNQLNQPEFHPFTADNQDYLAYICLILASGFTDTEKITLAVRSNRLTSFREFIEQVQTQCEQLSVGLQRIHREIYTNVLAGDPTPFKAFRRNEYRNTIDRMGYLPDSTPLETMLKDEIVITHEVRTLALDWKLRGALLFGLSDKPDEASIPEQALANQGYVALHRKETHVIGESNFHKQD